MHPTEIRISPAAAADAPTERFFNNATIAENPGAEMPKPAPRSDPRFIALSKRKDVHQFIRLVCSGRDFPASILDDELLEKIELYILTYGVEEGARQFKSQLSLTHKALIRAVSRNVKKMEAQGIYL